MADHLVVLQHGIWGTPDELENIRKALDTAFPKRLRLVCSDVNLDCTTDGVVAGGNRLADLIRREAPDSGGSLSLVCHSLGGIYARQALSVLEAEGWFEINGIQATNFVTTASPHLGIVEIGTLWRLGITIAGFAMALNFGSESSGGATIQDLALNTDLICDLSTGAALRALERFRRRAVYGNLQDDKWCRTCSSLILPSPPQVDDLPPGIPLTLPLWSSGGNDVGDDLSTFPATCHETARKMLDQLGSLSWERYVVDFPAESFTGAAHSKICQHAFDDTHNDGTGVVSHICLTFHHEDPETSSDSCEEDENAEIGFMEYILAEWWWPWRAYLINQDFCDKKNACV